MIEAYKRWRHSRGYGVHSPFAYDLVKMAIHPGRDYGYYGYHLIERAALQPGNTTATRRDCRDARLLLGILAQLRCRRLILPKGLPLMTAAAKGAGASTMNNTPERFKDGDFLLAQSTCPECGGEEGILHAISSGTPVMILDPSPALREKGTASMSNGLIMEGTRVLLLIPREGMALTTYTMKF